MEIAVAYTEEELTPEMMDALNQEFGSVDEGILTLVDKFAKDELIMLDRSEDAELLELNSGQIIGVDDD